MSRPTIGVEADGEVAREAVLDILGELPGWFGVPENDRRYAEAARANATWLARAEGAPIGVMTLTRPTEAALDLHLLAVRRRWHRRGVGRALVSAALVAARAAGARFLTVRTLGPSSPSAAYAGTRLAYARMGFAPLAELTGVWDDGRPMLLMVRAVEG